MALTPNRVADADVEEIYSVDSSIDLTAFITAAHIIVEKNLLGKGIDEDCLFEIERWLSAHAIAVSNIAPITARERAGSVEEAYQYKLGLNLQSSMYGQMAIGLDSTGTLLKLSTKGAAGFVFEVLPKGNC